MTVQTSISGVTAKRVSPGDRFAYIVRNVGSLRQSFQSLVDTYYDDVYSYVAYLTGGARESEDLTHEAFLVAFARLSRGEHFSGDPRMWLRGTVRNLVHEYWRKSRRLRPELAEVFEAIPDTADDVQSSMDAQQSVAALLRCMEKLPETERLLLDQRYQNDTPIGEMADGLGMNVSTLRVRLFRLRDALRACVERQLLGSEK